MKLMILSTYRINTLLNKDMRVAHPTDQVVDQEMIIMEEVIVVVKAAAVANHHKHILNTKQ